MVVRRVERNNHWDPTHVPRRLRLTCPRGSVADASVHWHFSALTHLDQRMPLSSPPGRLRHCGVV